MKAIGRHIALMLCLLTACALHAQAPENTVFDLYGESDGQYYLHFTLGQPSLLSSADGYDTLVADGMVGMADQAGRPALPQASRLLLLPRGSELRLADWEVHGSRQILLDAGHRLAPWQGGRTKDGEPPHVEPDKQTYRSATPLGPATPLTVEHLGTMGDNEVYRLTVQPVNYHPVRGLLQLTTAFDATLVASATSSRLIADHDSLPGKYLVVSRPAFRDGLQPFLRWKRQQGFHVEEIYADTNHSATIKALIAEHFPADGTRWPQYLLLVGDAAQLQPFAGTTHPAGTDGHLTDLYYGEHTGDYLPDVLVGRWPVNDTSELQAVVEKTLRYEQGIGLDTALLKRLLLVAGDESQAPAPTTTNGQVNYLAREIKLTHPALDTLTYRNPASNGQRDAILGDLQQGVALLNYTAHCTVLGWSRPAVTFDGIDSLGTTQPLLFVNNCCHSNAFGGTCFGEKLLRMPVGGAIGVVGATNATLWNEDYYWAVGPKYPFSLTPDYDASRPGAFDRWLGRSGGIHTQGALLAAGNMAVTAFGSPYDKFYWEIYCLLGDPSLTPWVDTPQALDLHLTDGTPHDGDGTLELGGTPGAVVTAMQHDSVLGIGAFDTNGLVALNLERSIDISPLVVTVTAAGHRPRIDTLDVAAAVGMAVAFRETSISDSLIECRVENVGTLPLHGLRVVLNQLQPEAGETRIAEQSMVVDTLRPNESRMVALPVQVSTVGQQPQWRSELFAWDSTEGMLCCITLHHPMSVTYPAADFRLLSADGSSAYNLRPASDYLLETTLTGSADSIALALYAMPGNDTLLQLLSAAPPASLLVPFTTPDSITHLHLTAEVRLGSYRKSYSHWLVGGERTDSYEDGIASYPWQTGGTNGWLVDSADAHGGRYSLRSGAIGSRQTSDLVLEVLLPQPDTLTYWARTSCEDIYDKLQFTVDGVQRANDLWGESHWRRYEVVINAGRHTLRWRYVKSESGVAGNDCAWIDDVRLPLALWDSAYGWFGTLDPLALPPDDKPTSIRIAPNPTTGNITVESATRGELQVMDLLGRTLYSVTLNNTITTLQLGFLPDGIYLLSVGTPTSFQRQKIIIRH